MGSIWEGSGRLLGALWPLLGASGALFFALFVGFSAYLNPFGVLVAIFGPKMLPRIDFGRLLGGFWEGLGRFLEGFTKILGRVWGDFRKDHYRQTIHA